MKYALRISFLGAFIVTSSLLFAKTVYLSASGNDNNSGESTGQAVASISRAVALADEGDIISISGIIDLSLDPDVTSKNGYLFKKYNLSLKGESAETSGFDAKGASRIFTLIDVDTVHTVLPDTILVDTIARYNPNMQFENLTFKNGNNKAADIYITGNALYIKNKITSFSNCIIENNGGDTSKGSAGGIYFERGSSSLTNCIIRNNFAKSNGGGLYFNEGSFTLKKCIFTENTATTNGGAFYLNKGVFKGEDLLIENNTGKNQGGGYYTMNTHSLVLKRSQINLNKAKEGGGSYNNWDATYTNPIEGPIRFESVSYYFNEATSNGGGLFLRAQLVSDMVFANSTFYGNLATAGGGIFIGGQATGSTCKFINCTVNENAIKNNRGDGGGIRVMAYGGFCKFYYYNCLIEGNLCASTSAAIQLGDFSSSKKLIGDLGSGTEEPVTFVKNSFIGNDNGSRMKNELADYADPSNLIDYYNSTTWDDRYQSIAGLLRIDYYLVPKDNVIYEHGIIPFRDDEEDLPGMKAGNPDYLKAEGIDTDARGIKRPYALDESNNYCSVGATEATLSTAGDKGTSSIPVQRILNEDLLKVYQTGTQLIIDSNGTEPIRNIRLTALSGQILYSNVMPSSGNYRESLSVETLSKGVYVLSVLCGENYINKKIMIQ